MGSAALLVEVADVEAPAYGEAAADALRSVMALSVALAGPPAGVIEMVPAARTVLVRFDPRLISETRVRAWIADAQRGIKARPGADAQPGARHLPRPETPSHPTVTLDVVYDGEDLSSTAGLLGVTVEALIAGHTSAAWTVAFTGFAPGFGYLVSDDWPHDVPRLDAPRTRVPAGSVALAAGFAGVYPRATPGGWRLLGTTDAVLFDPADDPPARLAPGSAVRFVAVRERVTGAPVGYRGSDGSRGSNPLHPPAASVSPSATAASTPASTASATASATLRPAAPREAEPELRTVVTVLEPGPLATVQDLGRPAAAALGIARSGALDRAAVRTANRLVGNDEGAAAIEITLGGFRARAERDVWVATTGAAAPLRFRLAASDPAASDPVASDRGASDRAADPATAHLWRAGEELALGAPVHGVRTYLALRGGVEAPRVAGSRASDLMSGLGPAPLRAGTTLALGSAIAGPVPVVEFAPWGEPHDDELTLALEPGPRADRFTADARAALFDAIWTVTADADRTGIRLDGPELTRIRTGELPSEGMVPGALQVPPSGRPTILLADGPVTGGYPVIAVVADPSLDALAQARPGTRIRFRHAPPV